MKALKSFTINFASLADGEHLFDYQIDNKFLKHFEATLIHEATIKVKLRMVKFLASLELNFNISGIVLTPCDICSEEFNLLIEGEDQILVKIVAEISAELDEFNVVYLEESSSSINIAEMLYELLTLSVPMRKVHPLDEEGNSTCDPNVLRFLEVSEQHLNTPNPDDDSDNSSSIWAELKKLK